MILAVLPEGGCWKTLFALQKYGGDISDQARGGKAREEAGEDKDHQPTCSESERPKDLASSWEIPMIPNASFPV